jgi:uncharacterized membrane protein
VNAEKSWWALCRILFYIWLYGKSNLLVGKGFGLLGPGVYLCKVKAPPMSHPNPPARGNVPVFTPLNLLSWATILATGIIVALYYQRLPDTIPIHFNGKGEADGFGSKTWLMILPAIALAISVSLVWLQRKPHLLNYPVKITPENAERQYSLASRFLQWLNVVVSGLFLVIAGSGIQAALSDNMQMSPWVIPFVLAVVAGPVLVYLVMAGFNRKGAQR